MDSPACVRPETLTAPQLAALSQDARCEYDMLRIDWHANFGTIVTPQLQAARMELELRVATNRQRGDQVRPATALDGLPGVGKTTIADAFCADYDRAARRRLGERTPQGDEHWPVLRIGLTSNTTLRSLNYGICHFYGRPGINSAAADQLGRWAIELVLANHTAVALIDEVHFIDVRDKDGVKANNHLKYLANVLPVTFIFTGVGLTERRYINEGLTGSSAALAQTARRWTTIRVEPFRYDT
ncbi:MAG: ATP-binding protein, partial [Dermatophilaceae bacterium]